MVELNELNLDEEKKKAKTFQIYETYVFVQTASKFYNGRICKVESDAFIFLDDIIPYPFPIRFDELIVPIVPSKKRKEENAKKV